MHSGVGMDKGLAEIASYRRALFGLEAMDRGRVSLPKSLQVWISLEALKWPQYIIC